MVHLKNKFNLRLTSKTIQAILAQLSWIGSNTTRDLGIGFIETVLYSSYLIIGRIELLLLV